MGYQDMPDDEEEDKQIEKQLKEGGEMIRKRQQSCYIKDLNPDEVPEFWKANFDSGQ